MVEPESLTHSGPSKVPKPRAGVALCLSGGGWRAALFHLGALRRLNELAVLGRVDTLSTVSGGSVLAAFLLERVAWPTSDGVIADWEEAVTAPFRQLTRRNIRTWPILKRVLLPWNWLRADTAVTELAATYGRLVTRRLFASPPSQPRWILSATDMTFGVNWTFDSGGSRFDQRFGDYQAGHCPPPADWPLARAVAASSAFPPVFNPLPVGELAVKLKDGMYEGSSPEELLKFLQGIRLSDGGVYDNMGLEPVWKDHGTVLVSDGGATFDISPDSGLLWRMKRYAAIANAGNSRVRKRWLMNRYETGALAGAYWGIGSAPERYIPGASGYDKTLAERVISEVRTDFDAFCDAEICVIENHGYMLADIAIRKHAPELAPGVAAPPAVPHPEWLGEGKVRRALAGSGKRKIFGRYR